MNQLITRTTGQRWTVVRILLVAILLGVSVAWVRLCLGPPRALASVLPAVTVLIDATRAGVDDDGRARRLTPGKQRDREIAAILRAGNPIYMANSNRSVT